MLKRWNFLKTGFYEGIKLGLSLLAPDMLARTTIAHLEAFPASFHIGVPLGRIAGWGEMRNRNALMCPILPYTEIDRVGAGMYKGRPKDSSEPLGSPAERGRGSTDPDAPNNRQQGDTR